MSNIAWIFLIYSCFSFINSYFAITFTWITVTSYLMLGTCIELNCSHFCLQECLNIFGSSVVPGTQTALKMSYDGYGHPLSLLYVPSVHISACSISVQWNLSWETTAMRDHLSWSTFVPYIPGRSSHISKRLNLSPKTTCLIDHTFMASGVVLQERWCFKKGLLYWARWERCCQ